MDTCLSSSDPRTVDLAVGVTDKTHNSKLCKVTIYNWIVVYEIQLDV